MIAIFINVKHAYIRSLSMHIEFKYVFLKFYIESKMCTNRPISMIKILEVHLLLKLFLKLHTQNMERPKGYFIKCLTNIGH